MKKAYALIILTLSASNAFANWTTWVINNTHYPLVLTATSSGKNGYCSSASCYPQLQNGDGQGVTLPNGNSSYITLSYNLCDSVSYNGSTPVCNGYVTNFTININSTYSTITEPDGKNLVSMNYNAANNNFILSSNQPPNLPVPAPQVYNQVPYRGVNLSGYEFGNGTMPPSSYFPTVNDAVYFIKEGANTIRIPIEWAYLQPNLSGTIGNNNYDSSIQNLVTTLTGSKVNVILDLHDYMRYGGTAPNAPVVGEKGSPATVQSLANVWTYLAKEYGNNAYVAFDLMNEPYPDSTGYPAPSDVVNIYNQVIAAIRATGANNLILLEGDNYSGLHSWFTNVGQESNAIAFASGKIHDVDNHFAINVHQYFDGSTGYAGNGTAACDIPSAFLNNINFNSFTQWLQQNNYQAAVTEFGGQAPNSNNDPNGYCVQDMAALVNAMAQNNNAFIGWTAWSGGHAWSLLQSPYPLDLSPNSDGSMVPQMTTLTQQDANGLSPLGT